MKMSTRVGAVAACCAVLFAAGGQAQVLVTDFSPDTTGSGLNATGWSNNFPSQIIGDQFTLTSNTLITGGAIFSSSGFGSVGMNVRFMIFADGAFDVPLHNIGTTVTAIDTDFTTTQGDLTRKVAMLDSADQFVLAAGTYWFSMPGDGVQISQATTAAPHYGDGSIRWGPGTLVNESGVGDMFFQIFTIPAPGALALLGVAGLVARRRRRA